MYSRIASIRAVALSSLGFAILIVAGCASRANLQSQGDHEAWRSLRSGTVAVSRPIVRESTISYSDSRTDQRYHTIDMEKTREAFHRDFRFLLDQEGIDWPALARPIDDSLAFAFRKTDEKVDSLPSKLHRQLGSLGIDALVLIYDLRLGHSQDVEGARNRYIPGWGMSIRKRFHCKCAVIDTERNRLVLYTEIDHTARGPALELFEKVQRRLMKGLVGDKLMS
jgi:hypothetical protein